jgi:hypothetical protein
MKPVLTLSDFDRAAQALGCDAAAIRAVCKVEAPLGGFQADEMPTILFERHKFSELTGGQFDRGHPDISSPNAGGYGLYSNQHARLARATRLDRDAALKATSWGKFQIMGANHAQAGFPTLQGFINAMYDSEDAHLDAFVEFIRNDHRKHAVSGLTMLQALRAHDWASFARLYNGPRYAVNQYDVKLAEAFRDERLQA